METHISGVETQSSGYYMADICFLILNVHQRRTRIGKRDGVIFGEGYSSIGGKGIGTWDFLGRFLFTSE